MIRGIANAMYALGMLLLLWALVLLFCVLTFKAATL